MRSSFTIAVLVLVGCSNPALDSARSTIALTQRVVTDLDARVAHGRASFGGEATADDAAATRAWADVQTHLATAHARLDDGEQSVDTWAADDSGDLAWRTVVPCLSAALSHLADALRALHAPDDRDLEEAIAKTHAESVDTCHEREADP